MPATIEAVLSECEKVIEWRLLTLIEAGYPVGLAEQLAASECDLHLAVDMVAEGCDYETAAEILL